MTKQNLNNIYIRRIGIGLFFVISFFMQPQNASAAPLFGSCSTIPGVTGFQLCSGDNTSCEGYQDGVLGNSIKVSGGPSNICWPQPDYESCVKYSVDGNSTAACKNDGDNSLDVCVVIVSPKNTAFFGTACIPRSVSPLSGASDAFNDKCKTDNDCNPLERCVLVDSGPMSAGLLKSTTHNVLRCLRYDTFPPVVAAISGTNQGAGSCITNEACKDDEYCMFNPASSKDKANIFSCIKKVDAKEDAACPDASKLDLDNGNALYNNVACTGKNASCYLRVPGLTAIKNKKTVGNQVFAQTMGLKYLCVGEDAVPQNVITCVADSQCKTKDATQPYCIKNPLTSKGQCFGQSQIYTDMTTAMSANPKCGTGADAKPCKCPSEGIKGCLPGNDTSICADYYEESGTFVCLNTKPLNHGAATQPITTLPPTLTPERTERPAPKLEIDIPGLEFTDTVAGQSVSEGQVFTLPFLAQYINAVYRYAIGFGIVLAVVMLMYAGLRWMTSLGNAGSVSDAKSMVSNAVLGLVLLMSAYTILYVINPDLVQLKSIQIFEPNQDPFVVDDNAPSEGQKIYSKGTQCFMTTFGATKEAVKAQLVPIKIFDHTWQVHKLALPAFQKVADALKGSTYKITDPSGGTFSWRPNANNPDTISLHSFGVAIDLNPHPNGNFKSSNPKCKTNGNLPPEVMKAFKDAGFKWGGEFKSHCDLMHFEWYGPCGK